MADTSSDRGSIQVITRAAAVLEALAEADGGQTLVQLSKRTGLPKTTVHRICGALEQVGYVHVDPESGRRELGAGVMRLAAAGRHDLPSMLEPYLARLARDLNETADLAVLDGLRILFVAQQPAPQRELMAIARVGAHFPAHSMASGKVLLALLPDDVLRRRLPARLPATLEGKARSRDDLLRELAEVRRTGLGYEREELRPGICAVAVAVTDPAGRSASIAVPMPTSRFHENEAKVAKALLDVRAEVHGKLKSA